MQKEMSIVNRQHRMKDDENISPGQESNGYIMQVGEGSSDEIVNGEVLVNARPSTQEEKLENTKILSICRLFVAWPKLSFGELS